LRDFHFIFILLFRFSFSVNLKKLIEKGKPKTLITKRVGKLRNKKMKKLNLNFREIEKFANFDSSAKKILNSMMFPIEGNIFEGKVIKIEEEESVGNFLSRITGQEDVEKFALLKTAISFASSLKLKEEESRAFLVRNHDNALCAICVYGWGKGNNNLIKVFSIENGKNCYFQNGERFFSLFAEGSNNRQDFYFKLEEGVLLPDKTFRRHIFSKRSCDFPVLVSPDKEIFFIEKEGKFEKIEKRRLPQSVQRFFKGEVGTIILSSFVKNNIIFSLMENGLLFDGQKICPKNSITKMEYENLVQFAEDGRCHDQPSICLDWTPCLFYEE